MMVDNPTFSTVNLNLIFDTYNRLGYRAAEIKSALGLNSETFGSDQDRISQDLLSQIWSAIDASTNDSDIGLHIAEHCHIGASSVVSYLVMSSRNLLEGLRRLINYQRIIGESVEMTLREDESRVVISYTVVSPEGMSRTQAEFFALFTLRMATWVLNLKVSALQITFCHAKPDQTLEHDRLLACPIVFDAPSNSVTLDKSLIEVPSPHSNPHMRVVHEEAAKGYVKELESIHLIDNVRAVITETLEIGAIHIDNVAKVLGMSERQLKEALLRQNTSFSDVLEALRRELAQSLLTKTQYSITDIAYLCGYAESSSFVRAFRRWYSIAPSQYRKRVGSHSV